MSSEKDYQLKLKEILNMPWRNIGPDLKDALSLISTILALSALFFCAGCSTTISVVNSHGTAEDVVDTEQTTDPELSPTLDLSPSVL